MSRSRTALAAALAVPALLLSAALSAQAPAAEAQRAEVTAAAQALQDKVIAWRRDLHQHPELGNREFRTAGIVADHLRSLPTTTPKAAPATAGWRSPRFHASRRWPMAEPDTFGGLLERLRQQSQERHAALETLGQAPADYPRLAAVDEFRDLWSRLRTREQLRTALAPPPSGAGPLNSASLAQRALTLMHDTSPGYLQHFIAWLDGLSWLERMQADGRPGPRQAAGKRARRPPAKNSRTRKRCS